jgi:hypothetical protein
VRIRFVTSVLNIGGAPKVIQLSSTFGEFIIGSAGVHQSLPRSLPSLDGCVEAYTFET